jgi:hypothetical protein
MRARSLRVAVIVVIIVIFVAVAFVFLFVIFLVWLLSKEDIGTFPAIKRVWVKIFWTYSAHGPMLCPIPLANHRGNESVGRCERCAFAKKNLS